MTFMNFYDITNYINECNNNILNNREVAEIAFIYFDEYKRSIKGLVPTFTMIEVCKLLVEDMDYMDYLELENRIDLETMKNILKKTLDEI